MMASTYVRLSEATLKRKIWLEQARDCLSCYRPPHVSITQDEIAGLAAYLDCNITPADAAELYQAARGTAPE